MPHGRAFLKYWLPVIVWMAIIFSASTDFMSSQRTSRIIGPLVRWLFPGIGEETVGLIVFTIRKCAHVAEYALLSVLVWRALRRPANGDSRPWSWRDASLAIGISAAYAMTDELHQAFVASRWGSAQDVLLDTIGATTGVMLVRVWFRWRYKR